MNDDDRCQGVNAKGVRCGSRRMSNFAQPSHLLDPAGPWYCHRHKDQQPNGDKA